MNSMTTEIVAFNNSAHRDEVIRLWELVFGYEASRHWKSKLRSFGLPKKIKFLFLLCQPVNATTTCPHMSIRSPTITLKPRRINISTRKPAEFGSQLWFRRLDRRGKYITATMDAGRIYATKVS